MSLSALRDLLPTGRQQCIAQIRSTICVLATVDNGQYALQFSGFPPFSSHFLWGKNLTGILCPCIAPSMPTGLHANLCPFITLSMLTILYAKPTSIHVCNPQSLILGSPFYPYQPWFFYKVWLLALNCYSKQWNSLLHMPITIWMQYPRMIDGGISFAKRMNEAWFGVGCLLAHTIFKPVGKQ